MSEQLVPGSERRRALLAFVVKRRGGGINRCIDWWVTEWWVRWAEDRWLAGVVIARRWLVVVVVVVAGANCDRFGLWVVRQTLPFAKRALVCPGS